MRFWQKLFKQSSMMRQGIVALGFYGSGFAIAVTHYSSDKRPKLLFCDYITAPKEHWVTQLHALVRQYKLEQFDCHILLNTKQYRMFSVELPQVHPDELKQALRWLVAEQLDYPIDNAIVDYYLLPTSNRANRNQMVDVITCRSQVVQDLLQNCKQAGLNVKVIDIQETALRNLATLLPENEQGVGVLHLQDNSGQILVEKSGAIHLSRKFEFNIRWFAHDSSGLDHALSEERNNLALEIQRSLDYVENFYDIPPINVLATILMPNHTLDVINFLMIEHGITARVMDLSAIVEGDITLSDGLQNQCAPVIGASLRRYVEFLA